MPHCRKCGLRDVPGRRMPKCRVHVVAVDGHSWRRYGNCDHAWTTSWFEYLFCLV